MALKSKKDQIFYELMEQQAKFAAAAASEFLLFARDFTQMESSLKKLEQIEHDADAASHELVNKINTQFITPLDKEDLHGLADRLDDITDTIEKAASRIQVYRIPAPRPELVSVVTQLVEITAETVNLVSSFKNGFVPAKLSPIIAAIHESESKSDRLFRAALTTLFEDTLIDDRLLLKWKEVFEIIEKATNRTEKLAAFVESLMVKYA